MADTGPEISVLRGLSGVRARPSMYFGVDRGDPRLADRVFRAAVLDALAEQPTEAPLHVRVVVDHDHRFGVEDNGPGLPVRPIARERGPAVTEMLTELVAGHDPPRGWGLAMVTALCSVVTVNLRTEGQHYRQQVTWTGPISPLETLRPSRRHGTHLAFALDEQYLAASVLSPVTPDLVADLLAAARFASGQPAVPGIRLTVVDHRTGVDITLARG